MLGTTHRKHWFVGLVLILFALPPMARAGCADSASSHPDRDHFEQELKLLKNRTSGYKDFQRRREQLEAQRVAGANEQRQLRRKELERRNQGLKEFHELRVATLKRRKQAMMKAWREYAGERREHRLRLECARKAYAREHERFRQAESDILSHTEEQELNVYAR